MSRENVEKIIRENGPDWWGQSDMDHIASNALEDPDRDFIAHDFWSLGAGMNHPGCRYGGEDTHDGDYSNECATCEAHLLGVADRVLDALKSEGSES